VSADRFENGAPLSRELGGMFEAGWATDRLHSVERVPEMFLIFAAASVMYFAHSSARRYRPGLNRGWPGSGRGVARTGNRRAKTRSIGGNPKIFSGYKGYLSLESRA